MAQQKTTIESTDFTGGLITEVNPLTFPPNASVDELNFNLNRDGTRSRRLGMDYENEFRIWDTFFTKEEIDELDIGVFRWENVGEDTLFTLGVVWCGNQLFFHSLTEPTITDSSYNNSKLLSNFDKNSKLSVTAVDGRLIVASGSGEIAVVEIASKTSPPEVTYQRLFIRDLFGVGDSYSGSDTDDETIDLRSGNNVQFRPKFPTDNHVYNLRNQSWGTTRRPHVELHQPWDPIVNFHTASYYTDDLYRDTILLTDSRKVDPADPGVLPSNSDIVHYAMAPDADDDPPTDNFFARTLFDIPIGNVEAPRGYFVIDALNRGSSRLEAFNELVDRYYLGLSAGGGGSIKQLFAFIDSLPQDVTPGGASQVAEFAGRVWYGGFSGGVIGGDNYSPKLSSYVMFSQLVESTSDINKCYQKGDPASEESPDIVDTDGGYIRISGCHGINKMINLGSTLAVLADNGLWMITGKTTDSGFTATGFQVSRISEYPLVSSNSVVEVDNSLVYWSDDGIYILARNEVGLYSVKNLTQQTIQTFYESIPIKDKSNAFGIFDQFERKIRWVYGNNKELVFDVNRATFTPNSINSSNVELKAAIETASYSVGSIVDTVVVGGSGDVLVNGEAIVASTSIRSNGLRSIKYLSVLENSGDAFYTFSNYQNQEFIDWLTFDDVGVDAAAYMVSGYMTGGDTQRDKQVPYITTHFLQTETGFDSEFNLLNQSSCKVRSQWDWTNSANSNRWGSEFQAYRLGRVFFPSGSEFDNGDKIVTTKSKLRGRGKALSLLFSTEPEKDCHLMGWSMLVGVKGGV